MMQVRGKPHGDISRGRLKALQNPKKLILIFVMCLIFTGGLYAQIDFPAGDFWSLDAGLGMSGILVDGHSFQAVLDPKLWLSPPLMVGTRLGVNYSLEDEDNQSSSSNSNILTFEGQVYLRWNFLRLGQNFNKQVNIFAQAGLGMIAAYRGDVNPFDNVTDTRGSIMFDGALGLTIPLTERWHIEPQVRGGYSHLFGVSLTAGYKFRLPEKTRYIEAAPQIEYREVIRTIHPAEIVRRIMISSVEYILFGPDIGRYNIGIDNDAQGLNELVLNETAEFLIANPGYTVRLEGHANPVTTDPGEADELMALSAMRANNVAEQLRQRGVPEEQMAIIAFGGTRTVTSQQDLWNRNRRVELIVIYVDTETE